MRFKIKCFALIITTICLGVYLQKDIKPNQQIVVKFQDSYSLVQNKQATVAQIENVLTRFGAKTITINTLENGELKITYFSTESVQELREEFATVANIELGIHQQNPKKSSNTDGGVVYNLHISELQQSYSNNWDFEGVEVASQHFKSHRFFQTKISFNGWLVTIGQAKSFSSFKRIEYSKLEFKNENKSYQIPEVRAGPTFIKIA